MDGLCSTFYLLITGLWLVFTNEYTHSVGDKIFLQAKQGQRMANPQMTGNVTNIKLIEIFLYGKAFLMLT